MTKSKTGWLLILILIIAGFLRLYQITTIPPGLYPDEAMNGNNALEALRTRNFKVFYPENNGREGLFINIQAVFLKIFGVNEPWVLRLPSAIFGILTVLGIYLFTRELFKDKILFYPRLSRPPAKNLLPEKEIGQLEQINESPAEQRGLKKNEILALLAAFLLSTNFWHINFSRIGFRAIMAPMLLVWALYFLLLAFRKLRAETKFSFSIFSRQSPNQPAEKLDWRGSDLSATKSLRTPRFGDKRDSANRNRSFRSRTVAGYFLLSGAIFGLGFYTYIAYRVMPFLILAILIYYWRISKKEGWQKKFLISAFYFLLAAFIIVLPLGNYYLQHPADFLGRTSQLSIFSSETPIKDLGWNIIKTAGMFNFVGDWNWRHNYAGRPEFFWPTGILFLIGVIIGIKALIKKFPPKAEPPPAEKIRNKNERRQMDAKISNFSFFILILWFILAAVPVVISNEGLPHALRAILMLPPAIIFAAAGGSWFYEAILTKSKNNTKRKKILLSAFYFLLALLVFEAYQTYFILWAKNPNTYGAFSADYAELGRKLNLLPQETQKYIVVEAKGISVRGIPMPAQTVMFITDTFSPENQKAKNIYYLLPTQEKDIPSLNQIFYLK